ncbi:MAG: Hint domain-containing protein [Rhodobacterales bacterium]
MGANIVGTTTGSVIEKSGIPATGDLDNSSSSGGTWSISSAPTYGTVTINSNGLWTYTLNDSNPAVDALNAGETMTDVFVVRLSNTLGWDTQTITITINGVPCFLRGTHIDTPDGPRPVESLRAGDLVLTLDAGPQEIVWIGSDVAEGSGTDAPVLIREGALGNRTDLYVSPQHRMLICDPLSELHSAEPEVLVAAVHLVNGKTILRAPRKEVEYFHILLDEHQIIFAEGAPSESFFAGSEWASEIPAVAAWCRRLKDRAPAAWASAMQPARPLARGYEGRVLAQAKAG